MEIRRLRERIESLECELLVLKAERKTMRRREMGLALYRRYGLTASESSIILTLMSVKIVPIECLYNELYSRADTDGPDMSTVRTFISKINVRLRQSGAKIQNLRGLGYYLTNGDKKTIEDSLCDLMN